jgi:hypothetical protein
VSVVFVTHYYYSNLASFRLYGFVVIGGASRGVGGWGLGVMISNVKYWWTAVVINCGWLARTKDPMGAVP